MVLELHTDAGPVQRALAPEQAAELGRALLAMSERVARDRVETQRETFEDGFQTWYTPTVHENLGPALVRARPERRVPGAGGHAREWATGPGGDAPAVGADGDTGPERYLKHKGAGATCHEATQTDQNSAMEGNPKEEAEARKDPAAEQNRDTETAKRNGSASKRRRERRNKHNAPHGNAGGDDPGPEPRRGCKVPQLAYGRAKRERTPRIDSNREPQEDQHSSRNSR